MFGTTWIKHIDFHHSIFGRLVIIIRGVDTVNNKQKLIFVLVEVALIILILFVKARLFDNQEPAYAEYVQTTANTDSRTANFSPTETYYHIPTHTVTYPTGYVPKTLITSTEIDLISIVVMAEAEGESDYSKRLVIDTILNRVDSAYFPEDVYSVIWQPGQFTSMRNGRADRCFVKPEIRELVIDETIKRTNSEVIFFMAGHYSKYGRPMFQSQHHYFSSYK